MKQIYHSNCLRCGRKLKNIEYQKLGYGKICFMKIQKSNKQKLFEMPSTIKEKPVDNIELKS